MWKLQTVFVCISLCLTVSTASLVSGADAKANSASSPTHAMTSQIKRRSVIDYFYLLPFIGIDDAGTQREKRELLQSRNHPIIDLRHDYLLVHPDSSPAQQIAIFRARGKADLIAVSMPDYESDYNFFALYRLQNGKLQDATRRMLPVPPRTDGFLYQLPRIGTTVRVFSFDLERQSRRYAFSLQWRQGQFVKVR